MKIYNILNYCNDCYVAGGELIEKDWIESSCCVFFDDCGNESDIESGTWRASRTTSSRNDTVAWNIHPINGGNVMGLCVEKEDVRRDHIEFEVFLFANWDSLFAVVEGEIYPHRITSPNHGIDWR